MTGSSPVSPCQIAAGFAGVGQSKKQLNSRIEFMLSVSLLRRQRLTPACAALWLYCASP